MSSNTHSTSTTGFTAMDIDEGEGCTNNPGFGTRPTVAALPHGSTHGEPGLGSSSSSGEPGSIDDAPPAFGRSGSTSTFRSAASGRPNTHAFGSFAFPTYERSRARAQSRGTRNRDAIVAAMRYGQSIGGGLVGERGHESNVVGVVPSGEGGMGASFGDQGRRRPSTRSFYSPRQDNIVLSDSEEGEDADSGCDDSGCDDDDSEDYVPEFEAPKPQGLDALRESMFAENPNDSQFKIVTKDLDGELANQVGQLAVSAEVANPSQVNKALDKAVNAANFLDAENRSDKEYNKRLLRTEKSFEQRSPANRVRRLQRHDIVVTDLENMVTAIQHTIAKVKKRRSLKSAIHLLLEQREIVARLTGVRGSKGKSKKHPRRG